MPKSNLMKQAVLNYLCRNNISTPQPSQLWLSLYITNPTDADVGTEVSYTGYQRQSVTFGSPQLTGSTAVVSNSNILQFAVVPSSAGSMAYFGLRTASSGGDLVYYGPLPATYQLNIGVQPIVQVGSLQVSEK